MNAKHHDQVSRMSSMCAPMMAKIEAGEWPEVPCQMSESLEVASRKPGFRLLAVAPGLLLLLAGVAIILDPRVLVWLASGLSIFLGTALLAMGHFVRKSAAHGYQFSSNSEKSRRE